MLSFETDAIPKQVDNGYFMTDYLLRRDGTIVRRDILYRNPRKIDKNPDSQLPVGAMTRVIFCDSDGYLVGDPEVVNEEEIDEGEYVGHIRFAEEKLDVVPRRAEHWRRYYKGL